MSLAGGDFTRLPLGPGICLHLNPSSRFKSLRVDLFTSARMRPGDCTRVALISRLLERGTRRYPDLARLGRAVDELDGALLGAEVDQLGDRQLLHLFLQVLDPRYARRQGRDLLGPGLELLHELLGEPAEEGNGFRRDYLRQEKAALRQQIASLYNDKLAYAQRRCIEVMCGGEPFGLSSLGDPADLAAIRAPGLRRFHRALLATSPIDLFVSGRVDDDLPGRLERFVDWKRQLTPPEQTPVRPGRRRRRPRRVIESQEVSQGRLVLGFRTGIRLGDPCYAALSLFNLTWGGDTSSRLFRKVREQAGLCYYIGSHLEPLCGLLFVSAGVEEADLEPVLASVEAQRLDLAQGRMAAAELENAKSLLAGRLTALDDDRPGLARFCYRQQLGGASADRDRLRRDLAAVTRSQVAEAAMSVTLDTVYFLKGTRP
ncbi:MAG: insulinase family protein [Candidatus Latescibacterota bacterium]|jgi:predicted Zn-dependent peptidase